MRVWLILLVGLFFGSVAHAQWVEQTWPEVVRDSELIVRARVVQGGTWGGVVEVERTFAGNAPATRLTIVSINDPMFPPEVIRERTWRVGDVKWLFLDPWEGPRFMGEPAMWEHEGLKLPPKTTFAPPSPYIADIPLRDDGVHVRVLAPVIPDPAGTTTRTDWEALLEDLVRVHRDRKPAKTLAAARSCLGQPHDEELATRFAEPRDAACLARLAILRETRWDDRLPAYGQSKHPATRAALGALAVGLDDPRADTLMVEAVLDREELVFTTTLRAGLDGRKERLGDVLAVLLPASRWSPPPELPVDPAVIRTEHARMNLTRALGALQRPKDEVVLVNEVPFANPKTLYAMLEALHNIRPGAFVGPAVEVLAGRERKLQFATLEVAQAIAHPGIRDALEAFLDRDDIQPDVIRRAMWALEPIADADTARQIRARITPRLTDDVSWDSATVDMVAAEMSLLFAVEAAGSRDIAFEIARLYLGWPKELADPAQRTRWDAFVAERTRRAKAVLPKGSTVNVRVVATKAQIRSGAFGQARVYVDAKVPKGLVPEHQAQIAESVGTPKDHVKVCGVGERGHRCYEKRGTVWRLHQVLAAPTVRAIGEAAGYGDRPLQPVDRTAAAWFALALERDLATLTDTAGAFDDLKQAKHRRENPPPPIDLLPPPPLPPGIP